MAVEGRRSVRSHGTRPVTVAEIGELLYRTARVRSLIAADKNGGQGPSARGTGYELSELDTGVLIQSLYLVCTAMHLAPCALGSADIEAAARAFGTDWRVEPCLGQFIVGSEPDSYARDVKRRHDVNDAEWADFAHAYRRDRPWPGAGQ